MRMSALRYVPLAIVALALLWAAGVVITGGFVLQVPLPSMTARLSSRDPLRALAVALVFGAWYAAQFRRHADADLGFLVRVRWPAAIAAVAAFSAFVIGVRFGTFTASSSDASGYVSQADMWLHGRFETPMPMWVDEAPWPNAAVTATPLGYRPARSGKAMVPTYAPGLPIMMAALAAVGGPTAVYFVVPLLGATAAWATYLLGLRLAGAWVGAAASLLLIASPVFLIMLVQPMSDVPVAALWTLALAWALASEEAHARWSGLASSLAIVTRPNLLPLAAIVGGLVFVTSVPHTRWRRVAGFIATSGGSVVVVAIVNWNWYGSPFESGYGSLGDLYAWRQFLPNIERYTGWLMQSQTPAVMLFVAAPFVIPRSHVSGTAVWLAGVVFPIGVLALYVFYNPFEEWWYLRFLLPALPAMLVGLCALVISVFSRLPSRGLAIGLATAMLASTAYTSHAFADEHRVLEIAPGEQRYRRVAEYTERMPRRSVFVCVVHTGSLRFYARRDVLRWEALDPASLDNAVSYLRAHDYDVYLVAEGGELDPFRLRFSGMKTLQDFGTAPPAIVSGVAIYALGGSTAPPRPYMPPPLPPPLAR